MIYERNKAGITSHWESLFFIQIQITSSGKRKEKERGTFAVSKEEKERNLPASP
jgi:hypothetical protein